MRALFCAACHLGSSLALGAQQGPAETLSRPDVTSPRQLQLLRGAPHTPPHRQGFTPSRLAARAPNPLAGNSRLSTRAHADTHPSCHCEGISCSHPATRQLVRSRRNGERITHDGEELFHLQPHLRC